MPVLRTRKSSSNNSSSSIVFLSKYSKGFFTFSPAPNSSPCANTEKHMHILTDTMLTIPIIIFVFILFTSPSYLLLRFSILTKTLKQVFKKISSSLKDLRELLSPSFYNPFCYFFAYAGPLGVSFKFYFLVFCSGEFVHNS